MEGEYRWAFQWKVSYSLINKLAKSGPTLDGKRKKWIKERKKKERKNEEENGNWLKIETRNTLFRCWNQTVKSSQSQNNAIWKLHNFGKNWPEIAKKMVKATCKNC